MLEPSSWMKEEEREDREEEERGRGNGEKRKKREVCSCYLERGDGSLDNDQATR